MSKRNPKGNAAGADDVTEAENPGPVPSPPGEVTGDDPPADDPPLADDPPSDEPAEAVTTPSAKRPSRRPAQRASAQRTGAGRSGAQRPGAQRTGGQKSGPQRPGSPKSGVVESDAPETDEQQPEAEESTSTRPAPTTSEPHPATSGRPMTAADYARTMSADPASTAMFPRVSDDDDASPYTLQQPAVPAATGSDSAVTRQARLSLVHVDPWSVTQLAFVISTALMIVAVVAATVFWLVLNVTGVWDNLNDTINSVLSSEDGTFNVENYLGFGRVVGLTLVLSAINVVLMTALAAIGARLYNAATHLVGGIQVTFRERG